MEKHFITALLVLILLAPQAGLEAKSRHYDAEERDYYAEKRDDDAKKRYHKSKNRYHKSKKRHHKADKKRHHKADKKHRDLRAIKAKLKSLKQSIADFQTEIAALGQSGGGLPENLTALLAPLQSDIALNTGELGVVDGNIMNIIGDILRIDGSLITNGRVRLADLESAVMTLESDFAALDLEVDTLSGGTPTDLVFSAKFIQGNVANFDLKVAWANFKANATGSFSSIEIKNIVETSPGVIVEGSVKCANTATSTIATDIINELNTHIPVPGPGQPTGPPRSLKSITCPEAAPSANEGRMVIWNVGQCVGEVALNVHLTIEAVCLTTEFSEAAVIRPHAGKSWGGVGTDFGGAGGFAGRDPPSQTLQVILTR